MQQKELAKPSWLAKVAELDANRQNAWEQFITECKILEPDLLEFAKVNLRDDFEMDEQKDYEFVSYIYGHNPIYFGFKNLVTHEFSMGKRGTPKQKACYSFYRTSDKYRVWNCLKAQADWMYFKERGEALAAAEWVYEKTLGEEIDINARIAETGEIDGQPCPF